MQVINNFRAHVLHHSSAAEKMGKHELARNIASVKQEKNEGKCLKLIDKISAQHKLIKTIYEETSLDTKTKKKWITPIPNKVQCNEVKLSKLLDRQENYQKVTGHMIQSSHKKETPPYNNANMAKIARDCSIQGIRKALDIEFSGKKLYEEFNALTEGNGSLRSIITGLHGVEAKEILNRKIEGIPFSQFGTPDGPASSLIKMASKESLDKIASELNGIYSTVSNLYR